MPTAIKDAQRVIAFIVADESVDAGARDYAKALAEEIVRPKRRRYYISYLFVKAPCNNKATGVQREFPLNDVLYAGIPSVSDRTVQLLNTAKASTKIELVAVGRHAIDTAVMLKQRMARPVEINCVSHVVDRAMLNTVADHNVHLLAPVTRDALAAIDAGLAAQPFKLTPLAAVLNPEARQCARDLYIFLQTESGRKVGGILERGEKFAFVVLHAGCAVDGVYRPYTEEDARHHGRMLGERLTASTRLIVTDAGSRNPRDEAPKLQAFIRAFNDAQKRRVTGPMPEAIIQEFHPSIPCDPIKAGYMLAHKPGCVGFIANRGDDQTLEDAVIHVDNEATLLGVFDFGAGGTIESRMSDVQKYRDLGFTVFRREGETDAVWHSPYVRTRDRHRDAAVQVVAALRLAAG